MKQILLIAFLLVCAVVVMKVEDRCRAEKYRDLRIRKLTKHIGGEITRVSRKNGMMVYAYSFFIDEIKFSDTFQMEKKYEGVVAGSPVGVIYLKKNPEVSRIIFTDEDFNWIE